MAVIRLTDEPTDRPQAEAETLDEGTKAKELADAIFAILYATDDDLDGEEGGEEGGVIDEGEYQGEAAYEGEGEAEDMYLPGFQGERATPLTRTTNCPTHQRRLRAVPGQGVARAQWGLCRAALCQSVLAGWLLPLGTQSSAAACHHASAETVRLSSAVRPTGGSATRAHLAPSASPVNAS